MKNTTKNFEKNLKTYNKDIEKSKRKGKNKWLIGCGGCLGAFLILIILFTACSAFLTTDDTDNDVNEKTSTTKENDDDKNQKSDDDSKDTAKYKLSNTPKDEFTNLTNNNAKDIQRNPDNFKNKPFIFKGKIIQATEEDLGSKASSNRYRIAIDDDYDNIVLVELVDFEKDKNRLLEDDYVTVQALYKGLETYESVSHTSVTIPRFITDKEFIQKNNEQT